MMMHSVCTHIQACDGGHVHQLIKIHVQLQLDFLLVVTSMSVTNRLDRIRAHNDMDATKFLFMRSKTLLTLSTLWQLLRWIYELYRHSFICLCMLCPLLHLFLLQLILCLCNSCSSLSCWFNTCNSFSF